MPKVDASLARTLPPDDAYQALRRPFPLLEKLIAEGYTGRKGKGGFYRLNKADGARVKEAMNLATGDYAPADKPSLASVSAARRGGARALVAHADKGGAFAWAVMSQTLAYRSEEHTSELQSLMRTSYAVFCLKKKKTTQQRTNTTH